MSRGCAIANDSDEFGNPDRLAVVAWAMEDLTLPLDELVPQALYEVRRFSSDGTVVVPWLDIICGRISAMENFWAASIRQ